MDDVVHQGHKKTLASYELKASRVGNHYYANLDESKFGRNTVQDAFEQVCDGRKKMPEEDQVSFFKEYNKPYLHEPVRGSSRHGAFGCSTGHLAVVESVKLQNIKAVELLHRLYRCVVCAALPCRAAASSVLHCRAVLLRCLCCCIAVPCCCVVCAAALLCRADALSVLLH